jgi:hypothetical protein
MAAKASGKPGPAINADSPQFGFYWAKASKDGGRIPVCIYRDGNGDLVARSGTRAEHRIEDAASRWTWVAGNPVDRDTYTFAWTEGKWPDGTPTTAPALPAGSNLPTDPFERLLAEVDDKMASAAAFLSDAAATPDKTRADRARNLQAELLALTKQADALHRTEKQPILDQAKAVDERFRFRDAIKDAATRLRTVFENILKAEEARAREEARKRHEEELRRAEAERQRILAERQRQMQDDPIAAMTEPVLELPTIPAAPEPVKVQAGGGIGRAAGLKTVYEPEITDYRATLAHYQDHPDVRAAVEKLVKAETRLHKAATNIPGVTVRTERRAA